MKRTCKLTPLRSDRSTEGIHSSDSTFPEKLEVLRVGGAPSCAQKKTGRSPKLRYNLLGSNSANSPDNCHKDLQPGAATRQKAAR